MNLIQHFVNGKIISGKSERRGKVFNPAIGEQESEVILGLKSDLDEAVEIAKKALKNGTTLKEEALKTKLINEKNFNRIVDPKKMIYPS